MTSILKSVLLATIIVNLSNIRALADVTSQQVWDGLRTAMTASGFKISASETRNGNRLTIGDLQMNRRVQDPGSDASGTISLSVSSLQFLDKGDGTVTVVLPDQIPVILHVNSPEDGAFDVQFDLTQRNLVIRASGKPDEIRHDYAAEAVGLDLRKLVLDRTEVPGADVHADLSLVNVSGTSISAIQTDRNYTQNLNIGRMSYQASISLPGPSETSYNLSGLTTGLEFTGMTALPLILNWSDPLAVLMDGAGFDATWRYDQTESDISSVESGEKYQQSSKITAGSGRLALNNQRLLYKGTSAQSNLFLVMDQLPFPISLSLAKAAANVLLPLTASPTAQPFNLGLSLSDFVMSDMMWALFDYDEILPRDPISLALEISGTAKVLLDIFSPGAIEALGQDDFMPFELEDIDIGRLHLAGGGAALEGAGHFEFDNSDFETFEGMPRPRGRFETELKGGNRLLDRLIEIGLIQQSDAMAMRMMLSMFTIPGEGNDILKMLLEVTEEGRVLSNGQRIR